MRYEDLPANVRQQVDRKIGSPPKRPRGSSGLRAGHASWKCFTCDEIFTTWAAVERHDPTHPRIDCVLT